MHLVIGARGRLQIGTWKCNSAGSLWWI